MTYDTAKKLNEMEFEILTPVGYLWDPSIKLEDKVEFEKSVLKFPSLSELVRAIGDDFIELAQGRNADGTNWSAEAYPVGNIETGNTSEEAVAKLWITLNSK